MQGRFKRGSGAASQPDSAEPQAAPHQPALDAAADDRPADQQFATPGVDPETGDAAGDGDGTEEGRPAGRSRLRGGLTRRRATGMSRIRMRNWRIRTRLIALLLLPVVVATVLGGLRITSAMQSSQQLAQMANLSDLAAKATALADALETERDVSAGPLTANPGQDDSEVDAARQQTDNLSKAYNSRADSFDNMNLSGGNSLLMQVRKDMTLLPVIRTSAYTQVDNIETTIASYDTIIQDLLAITQDIALTSSNSELVTATRALQQFALEKDASSEQRALISAALARPGGADLSTSDQNFGLRLQNSFQNAVTNFNSIYGATAAEKLRARLNYNSEISLADRYAQQVLQPNGIRTAQPRTYLDWYEQASVRVDNEGAIESQLVDELKGKAQSLQSQADNDAILNGVLIALVLLITVIGAALVARSMVRSLTTLQNAAEDVAERRLPELVKTLSESDPHDVDVTVEPVGIDSADEIGHVAHAFDLVHSEAVRLAAEQALLRGNINAMFTNLSRRSQGLIQRQLSLISELESREADPDQLASLFKLDHLATRMRRNGENLLVLAGEDPGRRWTRPVPLVDVLRAAASEVEQYERIELAAIPSAEVAGRVVNDLVHLLAELLENATSFSSPQTRVRLTGHALPDGRVLVEIHDTGIGLSPDDLAEINERLANPPTVDVSVSRRMGLFVVGRLSLRHGIRIQLRPSDSGGTTALVMLPVDVTNSADRRGNARPGAPAGGQAAAKQQRGVTPTGRQQRPLPAGPDAAGGRPTPPALGQGPGGGQGAPGGRPQLGQGPSRPAAGQPGQPTPGQPTPGQPAQGAPTGGLPTRSVGQSLRETPPPAAGTPRGTAGLPRRGGTPAQGAPADRPAAPQGRQPGQDRTRTGAELPAAGADRAERPQPGQAGPTAPGGLPQRRPGAQGPDQGRPQGRPAAGAPAPRQQDRDRQGPPTLQQPAVRPPAPQQSQAPQQPAPQQAAPRQPMPQPTGQQPAIQPPAAARPTPEPAPAESTVQFARPRFEASDIDPRDPLGLGLVEPVLPSVASPAARPERPPVEERPQAPQQQPFPGQPQGQQLQQGQGQLQGRPQQPMSQQPVPQQPMHQQAPQPALPPRQSAGRPEQQQPIRNGGANRMASVQVNQPGQPGQPQQPTGEQQGRPRPYQPQRPGTSAPGFPQPQQPAGGQQSQPQQAQPQRPAPQQQPQAPQQGEAPWRPSANDERWRRAEQLREPSSDGVTLSGLPRRTPQANLVAGTAEAAPLTGPQVSRSPEEVRGRLTNLRRGIQQGRRAGAEATQGIPVVNQQFDEFGRPAGTGESRQDYRAQSADGGRGPGRPGTAGFGTDNQER
ncbi:nitrate- and nitrite sensing domain-containing protein [Kitasatospora sp. NPDC052896]|uniref:sensor histidine kinase n=1 Tax=Kitasatospora sp. NPDC052896 TaxID=3364061 RepID=UPI0037CA42A9